MAQLSITDRKWVRVQNGKALRHTIVIRLDEETSISIEGCLLQRLKNGDLVWGGPLSMGRGRTYRNVFPSPTFSKKLIETCERAGITSEIGQVLSLPEIEQEGLDAASEMEVA